MVVIIIETSRTCHGKRKELNPSTVIRDVFVGV